MLGGSRVKDIFSGGSLLEEPLLNGPLLQGPLLGGLLDRRFIFRTLNSSSVDHSGC
jgi:hypothetical protein